jgi:hypothetical protein
LGGLWLVNHRKTPEFLRFIGKFPLKLALPSIRGKGLFRMSKTTIPPLSFSDNPVIKGREKNYAEVTVDLGKIVASWRASLFSYEWMLPDGRIKGRDELPEGEKPKRDAVEERIKAGQPLDKPVLGIGLLENVEIGAGRAILLTVAAHGIKTMPVHIPATHADEFAPFIT